MAESSSSHSKAKLATSDSGSKPSFPQKEHQWLGIPQRPGKVMQQHRYSHISEHSIMMTWLGKTPFCTSRDQETEVDLFSFT